MNLQKVTLTGADNTVKPADLLAIAKEFPFVEWGILIHQKMNKDFVEGVARYPTPEWIGELLRLKFEKMLSLNLSLHLCGLPAHNIFLHGMAGLENHALYTIFSLFQRMQINTHGCPIQDLKKGGLSLDIAMNNLDNFKQTWPNTELIFQMDGENDEFFKRAIKSGLGVPLFDTSSGAGVLPDAWPAPIDGVTCGYAGGLGPLNVASEIKKIQAVVGDKPYWIDMETRLRSVGDVFDLNKCRQVLSLLKDLAAAPAIA